MTTRISMTTPVGQRGGRPPAVPDQCGKAAGLARGHSPERSPGPARLFLEGRLAVWMMALLLALGPVGPGWAGLPVVTTTTDLLAIVQAIGGDRVDAVSIGRGHEDPHFVEPRPSFLTTLGRAQLLFLIGLDLEIWLRPLLDGARNLTIKPGGRGYVDCSQVIPVKEIPTVRVDPSMGDVHPLGNPHYWLDPANALRLAELIARKLSEADPAGAATFAANLAAFRRDLEARIPGWKARLAKVPNRKIACFHSSWIYFTDAFGLEIVGYVEPRPGIPPTGREIAALVAAMQAAGAKVILRERYHPDRFADLVAGKVGGKVLVLPASVGAEPAIKTYPDLIETLVARLESALQ
ncbi:MAG: Zinc ABC transporter, periplasmic-binding protein ZnuA [Candidatus Ozemobacter sibiricus]|uniref:Zinc ABC transporter, periplasmic-binding protein ZnuA n=1 Tax=Candidatus Ozemobacter sibiricus TaxID=2268124 RepID=A0A367ZMJ5_9BACT|nr:MAG: Zinc ABC transporter, periplasmic-binding protein ZnuA [Candidatus Ozemobacter sibiricus]